MLYVFKAVKWLIRFIVSRWHPQGEAIGGLSRLSAER